MHSGEVLKRKIDCLNKARRLIREAESELSRLDGQNDIRKWSKPMRNFWKTLWKARRLMKQADKYDRKYHKMMEKE